MSLLVAVLSINIHQSELLSWRNWNLFSQFKKYADGILHCRKLDPW